MNKRICGVLLMIAWCTGGIFLPSSAYAAEDYKIAISEIQLWDLRIDGIITQKGFVELYNSSDEIIDTSNFYLEYAKPNTFDADGNVKDYTFGAEFCMADDWKLIPDINKSRIGQKQITDGSIQPRGRLIVELPMNDNVGGSVRLVERLNSVTIIHDIVGWGQGDSMAPCSRGQQAGIPFNSDNASLKRQFDADSMPLWLSSNAEEFILSTEPTPTTNQCPLVSSCPVGDDPPSEEPPSEEPPPALPIEYAPIWITELLPDPSLAADSEGEFIELFNPNPMPVSLEGYSLQAGATTSKKYVLPDYVINPNTYMAIYSSESNLTLSNSGSKAILYNPTGDLIYETPNYLAIKADIAWVLKDGKWELSNQPTPNAENKTNHIVTPVASVTTNQLSPCPAGQYRNPETNRCNKIVTPTALKPCPDGWYRNPETNRCKKIVTTVTASYSPCPEGYERNPETNRCRKIVTGSTLKPCGPGEERNPETNRCRKTVNPIAAVAGIETGVMNEAENKSSTVKLNWLIGVSLATFVVGYGVYEWRHEITSGISHLRDKLSVGR